MGWKFFLIFIGLILFQTSLAQSTSDNLLWDKPLDELLDLKVTTATRQEGRILSTPAVITVINAEDLRRWGADNLADGLRQASGLTIRKSPGDFPQYLGMVRGNASDFMNVRTLFMIDGVAVRNPNAGFDPSWIPLEMVKRVEIVKGPISSLYGANAFGGVINVITKDGSDIANKGEVEIGTQLRRDHVVSGDFPGTSAVFNIGREKSQLNYFASIERRKANDSDASYSGHAYQDVFGKISSSASDNVDLTLSALFSFDRNQIATANADTPIKNDFTHISGTMDVNITKDSTFKVTTYFNGFEHFLKYTDALEKYDNQGQGYGANLFFSTKINSNHAIVAGLEHIHESGFLKTKEMDYNTFTVSDAGWSEQHQDTYSIYLQDQYSGWETLVPIVGIRYDHNSLYGGAISPRAGLSLLLSESLSVYTAMGSAFRAPVFNETHINGYGKVGNTNLKPELTLTHEVGIKKVGDRSENSISYFHQDISKKIELIADPLDPSLKIYNNSQSSASIFGAEWVGSYRLSSNFKIFYGGMFTGSDDSTGKRVEKTIEKKITAGFNTTVFAWDFETLITHEGDQFFYKSNGDREYVDELTTVHIQASRKLGVRAQLDIYVKNLMDEKYTEYYSEFISPEGLFLPGRTVGLNFRTLF